MAIPVYRGRFGRRQAERLLWRAGLGPRPGEAKRLVRMGMRKAVRSLTNPPPERLRGPAPVDGDGLPIAPFDAWGHDLLWWLDRMARTNRPLVERMALSWHDWFATGDVGSQKLSLAQAKLLRGKALGPFSSLLETVTVDRAMLLWLSGIYNSKAAPNENYARELMELFTLGASDESGYPYSEDDVREQARALTGWRADWQDDVGHVNFRYDPARHDDGVKTVFGRSGRFGWRDSLRLCLEHDAHPRYFVEKLWRYFIPTAPPSTTRQALERMYVGGGYAVKPLVSAILRHPLLYEGPAMVKPPVVQVAGMLRARGRGIDTEAWSWLCDLAGQRLFRPPNVSGWDEDRWLDTSTFRGRWACANTIARKDELDTDGYDPDETAKQALARALRYWGDPQITLATRTKLLEFGRGVEARATASWQQGSYRALRQNALRMLIATSPDLQSC